MRTEITAFLAFLIFLFAVVGGYVANIVKLAGMCCDLSGWLVLRAFGVVAIPLGVVLGFL